MRKVQFTLKHAPRDFTLGNTMTMQSQLVDIANCSVDAFAIKVHCLHPILKVSNLL